MEEVGGQVSRRNDSLTDDEKTIREFKEKWAEELMFQKLRWEEI